MKTKVEKLCPNCFSIFVLPNARKQPKIQVQRKNLYFCSQQCKDEYLMMKRKESVLFSSSIARGNDNGIR